MELIFYTPQDDEEDEEQSRVFEEYLRYVAGEKLLDYKEVIHFGGKSGESLWTHVMHVVTVVEKLRKVFQLTAVEMRCVFLALTVHDINKQTEYSQVQSGGKVGYAEAAKIEHIRQELERLDVTPFFPEWEQYIADIAFLAHAHQMKSMPSDLHDQRVVKQCSLDATRLEGVLSSLMQVADVIENNHHGKPGFTAQKERDIRVKFLRRLGEALNNDGSLYRYRFVGHQLAELRGLLTNVVHNQVVEYLRERYGEDACIDLLYHPDGVDYLLRQDIPLVWGTEQVSEVAERVTARLADLQAVEVAQFIKAKPSGISVADAAMESGAPLAKLFTTMLGIVERKKYPAEWRIQKEEAVRQDLAAFLKKGQGDVELQGQVTVLLAGDDELVTGNEEALKCSELLLAYRNFLQDHRQEQLRAVKQDAWGRVARLFQLPEEFSGVYALVNSYRRAYAMARDLPGWTRDAMLEMMLQDEAALAEQAEGVVKTRKGKIAKEKVEEEEQDVVVDTGYIEEFLQRNLLVWDMVTKQNDTRPVQAIDFAASLRRYVDERENVQCCYCSSPFKTQEWMAVQVPASIGVQNFSNRLDGGSAREPKRMVCDVCRTQFILEKLAWRSHRDKHGSDLVTFYLHCFPYTFFTKPMLGAWWNSIQQVQNSGFASLFFDTRHYYTSAESMKELQRSKIRLKQRGIAGVGIPTFAEAVKNTPVLPLILDGDNYGKKFLQALERAILLGRWFDCRIVFSRLATPLLNLGQEYIGEQPVVLLVESVPAGMNWLLPHNVLTRGEVEHLHERFFYLHHIAELLTSDDEQHLDVIYELVTTAATDDLALYHMLDRLIEKHVGRTKGRVASEFNAIKLTHEVYGYIAELMKE